MVVLLFGANVLARKSKSMIKNNLILYVFLLTSPFVYAGSCKNGSYLSQYPVSMNPKLQRSIIVLCNTKHSNGYSVLSKTGIWATEYLTYSDIVNARRQSRQNNFHEDFRIPINARALLSDYRNSGYDRGHLYPNGDTPDRISQDESFSLSNMIPQDRGNNRNTWSDIEKNTRSLVMKYQAAYIVTGSAFTTKRLKSIGSGVLVPSHIWKAVYVPSKHRASAFISENSNSKGVYMSINELSQITGIDPFPALTESLKNDKFKW